MKISIEAARDTHEKLREILIKYGNEEYGDCIVDEISWLFNFPTTIDTETEGNFVDSGEYQLLDYTFKAINTEDGFTNIEVRDFNEDVVGEIAGLEIPDKFDDEAVIQFESVLITWLEGERLI
jgi:hypothetical protein